MPNTTYKYQESIDAAAFRDTLASVDKSGKRNWVYAWQPKGRFYRVRTYLSVLYFLLFFGLPFIYVNGRPLFMFDIPHARFVIFGKLFLPQDFFIIGVGMITFVLFIVLFTAAFGRLFCGWACPQTNFMEMMFRKVEYWIEGTAAQQKMLNKAPWNTEKFLRKTAKHIAFFVLSFIIANFFLSYIIGMQELEKIITAPVSSHVGGFMAILIFSGIFYGVYALFREQVCTAVCPYGRLQSVLLDKNSMIVAYDYQRGEPRGIKKKKEQNVFGDCVDCSQCIRVCPTGIDIRNGVQMECIGCTACIDACDAVMEKTGKPKGLVRYASENSIATGKPLRYSSRMKFYTLLCTVAAGLLATLIITRKDIDATVFRTPGMLFQERGQDSISNLYNIKFANKTLKHLPLSIRLRGPGRVQMIGKPVISIAKEAQGSGSFFVVLPKNTIHARKTNIQLELYEGNKLLSVVKTNFLGPVQ
ncbi:cytochrome c oxidase accessory protein CcoG [Foetidibacter luteolus]|uniref:cytochrome c oxidase accessory protein CcoG n=1 Tax=Foetidibacter luteolus TaxID=2608880 RepID=UPI00129AA8F2|nr:cytochrome c oxidase accessory protein CcoG [Foetidibacter luteolus]